MQPLETRHDFRWKHLARQFKAHCRYCDRPVGESAATLQKKLADLLADAGETIATVPMSYLSAPA